MKIKNSLFFLLFISFGIFSMKDDQEFIFSANANSKDASALNFEASLDAAANCILIWKKSGEISCGKKYSIWDACLFCERMQSGDPKEILNDLLNSHNLEKMKLAVHKLIVMFSNSSHPDKDNLINFLNNIDNKI